MSGEFVGELAESWKPADDYQLPIANAILTIENEARPGPAPTTRAATRPASRSRWPTCWTTCRDRPTNRPAPTAKTARRAPRQAPAAAEVGAPPRARVRAAGPLPVAGRRRRRRRHRRPHARAGRLRQVRRARTTTRCCTAASSEAAELDALIARHCRPQDQRDLADRARRAVDRRLRVPCTASTMPYRVAINEAHRAGQGVRRHRRPQVRQRRARQGLAADLRPAEVEADRAAGDGASDEDLARGSNRSSRST